MSPDRRFAFAVLSENGRFDTGTWSEILSQDAFDEYRRIVRVIPDIRPMIIDHIALEFDFYALEDIEPWLAESFQGVDHPFGPIGIMNAFVLARAQGALSNFLSSCSAFRDRLSSTLSKRFGADSDQARAWKVSQSRAFDNAFSYRLFYGLRNYAQHHDSPIHVVQVNGKRAGAGPMEHQIGLALDRDRLVIADQIKARLRSELNAGEARLPLMPLAREVMDFHRQFALEQILAETDRLAEMEAYAGILLNQMGLPPGAVPFILEGGALDPSQTQKRTTHSFSLDELAMIKILTARLMQPNPPRIEMGLGWMRSAS